MINRPKLLADLKVQVRDLESDLRSRFATHAEYKSRLTTDWQTARDAGRTSEALETWSEAQFTQSAVAWVLACVFVRFCEDNDLLDAPLIAGAIGWLECRVIPEPAIQQAHDLFVAEVVAAWADERAFAQGRFLPEEDTPPAWRTLHHLGAGNFVVPGLQVQGEKLVPRD